jgi:hypothetical protein
LWVNLDKRWGNVDDPDATGHGNPDAESEVNVIDSGDIAASQDGLLNLSSLLGSQGHIATGWALLSLIWLGLSWLIWLSLTLLGRSLILLGLTLLRLALLRLALLRRGLLGLALLGLIRLTLLTWRGLPLGLIALSALTLFALALTGGGPVTLSFTFSFGLGLLALPLTGLILTLLALPLTPLILTLLALPLTPLIALALLAFFLLPGRLIALFSALAPLGLIIACSWLLALLSSSPLSIAALRLLTVPASRPALGLSWASGLPAARRVLRWRQGDSQHERGRAGQ